MNCFDDLYLKDINVYSGPKYQFEETVDYLSNEHHIPDSLLARCHKSCRHFDMSAIIPSTASVRLQNISWRRLNKNLFKLKEVNPQSINWYKDYDINWCYGPKYPDCDLIDQAPVAPQQDMDMSFDYSFESEEIAPVDYDSDYDSDCESDSLQSTSTESLLSCNSMDSNSSSSSFETSIKSNNNIKSNNSNIKSKESVCQTNKRVKFNFIVSSREIINGIAIDYDFLDDSMIQV